LFLESGAQRAPYRLVSRLRRPAIVLVAILSFTAAFAEPPQVLGATASPPKVAIIVGPAGSDTPANRKWANAVATEAARYTTNVVKVYSPNATWSRVKAAIAGASIVVYIGRGRGFPSPYSYSLRPSSQDGFGLNPASGRGNSKTRYYGERYIRTLRLAPKAAVLLVRLSYASGRGEPGARQPTRTVARRRVDNYGAGFLAAGASAVIVEASTPAAYYLRAIFTRDVTLDQVWRAAPSHHGHVTSFSSRRIRGAIGRTDPVRTGAGYGRSIIGWPATKTTAVRLAQPKAVPPPPAPPKAPAPTPTPAPATSCGSSLRSRITSAASGSVLNLTGCTYTAGATVSKPLTIQGGTIKPARGTPGLVVTASNVKIDGLQVVGPQATTYQKDEAGIEVEGTVGTPIRNLTIRNCKIGKLGYGGIYVRHAASFVIENNRIYDGVYAGIMVVSGRGGKVTGNTIQRIGVVGADANGNNAYGIALSRGGGDLAASPRSADITVSGNTVEDVPTWHAFDTHGGERITWTDNTARRSRSGIFITGSPSSNGMVRSLDNDINGNTFSAPTGAGHYGVTSVYSTGGYVRNNTIAGWPSGHAVLTTSGGDAEATAVDLAISGNTVTP
jgi:parallel beta-helix repeat protein